MVTRRQANIGIAAATVVAGAPTLAAQQAKVWALPPSARPPQSLRLSLWFMDSVRATESVPCVSLPRIANPRL